MEKLRFASLIVTYRCNARCKMCYTWKHPFYPDEEFKSELLKNYLL